MTRSYTDKTLKLLWGRAAGRCAVATCRVEVFADATDHDPIVTFGDIAHIHAHSDTGARSNTDLTAKQRNDYENLILLCKNCHARIDGQKLTNTVDSLKLLKADHEAWVRASLPERGSSATGWQPLYLRGGFPFDTATTSAAVAPDHLLTPARVIEVGNEGPWPETNNEIAKAASDILAVADPFDYRIALFPLAPVSACIALGYRLTNRPHVSLFQYHRDARTWKWPDQPSPRATLSVKEPATTADSGAVCFLFHLSAPIASSAIDPHPIAAAPRFELICETPSTAWLQHVDQIREAAQLARAMFERARIRFPYAATWHIFYAGPAPIGVAVGQQLNPTMTPAVQLYEFRHSASPQYQPSITLTSP